MICPNCKQDKNPFINKPEHRLYGLCEDCFNTRLKGITVAASGSPSMQLRSRHNWPDEERGWSCLNCYSIVMVKKGEREKECKNCGYIMPIAKIVKQLAYEYGELDKYREIYH